METNKDIKRHSGYYVYSIFAIIAGCLLLAFIGYLLYDLFFSLATKEITNLTLIQGILTLLITIFLGGYFTKWLELKNHKKLEYVKTEKEIAIRIIDLAGNISRKENLEDSKSKLMFESHKAKLFFNEDISTSIFNLASNTNQENLNQVVNKLKKHFNP